MYDVVIRGGSVVDGTGGPAKVADVGIRGQRIETVGSLPDVGDARVIDAAGLVVAPGFVDVHTHYDAQVFWDTTLSPSPLHGVTTVIGGNCGFTIAPLSSEPADGDYLMRMLARVEGMPLESLQQGVPWDWTSFGEYLDRFDGTLSVNAGFKVGHSAIRRVVMGADATAGPASPEQLDAMRSLLRESLAAGGLGFSSTWSRTHNDADGNMVPSRHADPAEIIALCEVVSEFPGTSLEFLPMVGPFDDTAFDLMADMSVAAQRPLNWNLLNVTAKSLDDAWHQLEGGNRAAERGGKVVGLTIPMAMGLRLSFLTGFVLDALPGWEDAMALPLDQKMSLLADPDARAALDAGAQTDHPLRGIAHWSSKVITECFSDETRPYEGRTVGEIAEELGKEPFDTLVDIALADDLRTAFALPERAEDRTDWEARAAVWRDGRAVIGASDAGAHLDLLGTFNYSTHVLAKAVREFGVVSLEEAVQLITQVPASLYGLIDRGELREGAFADVVVFDPQTVAPKPLRTRFDLPGGAGRIYGEADGIDRVLVNGQEIVVDGAFTSARPGTLLRSGRDTRTPALT
ncbi:MAG: amidohydrolase family protein [Acidimicrobiia bacterium]|nr:amidohydrolase family protein [Acidimicrobiia bacterium]